MKVFELLRQDVIEVTEKQLVDRLKNFDWNYEFSESLTKQVTGSKELELIENLVYHFWKKDPNTAIQIWNKYSPLGKLSEDNSIPSFIFRLQAQDK